jgi:hypothetical protein
MILDYFKKKDRSTMNTYWILLAIMVIVGVMGVVYWFQKRHINMQLNTVQKMSPFSVDDTSPPLESDDDTEEYDPSSVVPEIYSDTPPESQSIKVKLLDTIIT